VGLAPSSAQQGPSRNREKDSSSPDHAGAFIRAFPWNESNQEDSVTTVNKIRIATTDTNDALGSVKTHVERATGFAATLEFQEIDQTELVVELRLVDWNAVRPGLVARAVEHSTRDLEVLSAWREEPLLCDPTPPLRQILLDASNDPMPEVARRALRDGLPTAQWLAIDGHPTDVGQCQWHLAVPMVRTDGQYVVGLRQRPGYSRRFNPLDAIAARIDLAS
jgi:hypothetical protein